MDTDKLTVLEIEKYINSFQGDMESLLKELSQDKRKSVGKLVQKQRKSLEKDLLEKERLKKLWKIEKSIYSGDFKKIVGIDEAGRGPLAGPVVAAAVILPPFFLLEGLDDSKKVSEKKRIMLAEEIKNVAIAWSVALVDEKIIDKLNILEATRHAMKTALDSLKVSPDFVLVDGEANPLITLPQKGIIKGDLNSASIAAASILAKTYRDKLMKNYDKIYPEYGFKVHKGYGTAVHLAALKKYGPCPIHRDSFAPVIKSLK
ncbi:RNase HII [Desulfonispora thiosulfatigenes DSM 11270]|uniref:Ribonuclease HII n=1 Tax=Desulfonispora thiosulfatigenes DSM 11270 TaxID=656914 RepID=A0A1W1VKP7_DESTI|nr:ribonuclease HII [Desulfonispora thiosulfatigenes]SMB93876.1 RNase HII [Desulfonispora thiosulfatigenes DSM 11270]